MSRITLCPLPGENRTSKPSGAVTVMQTRCNTENPAKCQLSKPSAAKRAQSVPPLLHLCIWNSATEREIDDPILLIPSCGGRFRFRRRTRVRSEAYRVVQNDSSKNRTRDLPPTRVIQAEKIYYWTTEYRNILEGNLSLCIQVWLLGVLFLFLYSMLTCDITHYPMVCRLVLTRYSIPH